MANNRISREMARRELAKRSFVSYLPYVHGEAWKRTRMSEYIAQRVQSFVETPTENAYDLLLILTAPQHGKSTTVTESFPAWYLGRYPTHRVILASYNDETAERFSRRNKEKIKEYGGTLFGIGIGDTDRATEFELDNGKGRLISRGLKSGITGNPANLIIIDDPIKNMEEADSAANRDKLWEAWQSSLKSRLAAGGKVIVILTPWHEDDLAARLMKLEHTAQLLRLPVEAEENDPLGRLPGEPLCPEIGKDEVWLADFKRSYLADPTAGARSWAALYQCSPRIEGGNLVHRDWWRDYNPAEITRFGASVISVDAAFKDRNTNDFVAITVWGKLGTNYYLRYVLNKHMNFPDTVTAIRQLRALYPEARAVLIEDKANGSAIIQTLQSEMFCIPVNPRGGKVSRVNAVSPAIESGHVFIPVSAPWREEYLAQWLAFPAGAHDDMVDSSTQALSYMLRSGGTPYDGESTEEKDERERATQEEQYLADGDMLFDPYHLSDYGSLY